MKFIDILKKSEVGKKYSRKLIRNMKAGVNYELVVKANKVLEHCHASGNTDLISQKFNQSFEDVHQLFDKITELLVAYEFLEDDPRFLPETGGPDIFLKITGDYVEVKRVNISEKEKEFWGKIFESDEVKAFDISDNLKKQSKKWKGLINKTKSHIDKALNQIGNKSGYIYLVFGLDKTRRIGNLDTRRRLYKEISKRAFEDYNKKNIKFKIKTLKDILGK